jgi:hypothetical protein
MKAGGVSAALNLVDLSTASLTNVTAVRSRPGMSSSGFAACMESRSPDDFDVGLSLNGIGERLLYIAGFGEDRWAARHREYNQLDPTSNFSIRLFDFQRT